MTSGPLPPGPSRLVPVLRRLLGGAGQTEDRSVAVTSLLNKVNGGRTLLRSHLLRLNPALAAQEERAALAAVEDILLALQASPATLSQTFIVTVLYHWFRRDLDPRGLMRALRRHARDLNTQRLMAVAMERAGLWDAAVYLWDQFLTTMIQSGVWPAASREVSRVLLHMAELSPADCEGAWDPLDVEFDEDLPFGIGTGALPDRLTPGHLLEREPGAAEGDHGAYLLALPWVAARKAANVEAAAKAEELLHARVGNQVGANLILRGAAHSTGLEPPRPIGGSPRCQAIEGLARACAMTLSESYPYPRRG